MASKKFVGKNTAITQQLIKEQMENVLNEHFTKTSVMQRTMYYSWYTH